MSGGREMNIFFLCQAMNFLFSIKGQGGGGNTSTVIPQISLCPSSNHLLEMICVSIIIHHANHALCDCVYIYDISYC